MKSEKSCGAMVMNLVKGVPQVLLVKHEKTTHNGHWDFPKGHPEKEESEEQTALREVKEETGVTASIIKGFREEIHYSPKKGTNKTVVFFLATTHDHAVKVQKGEIEDFRWLPLTDAMNLLTFATAKSLLQKAEIFLKPIL